ncbi:MAG TPA: pilus assembly protein TadG-related protein [Gemmatimonadaceae bacterium]|nr:pilus assembly protein TadG-related protein [Gemmatimonadaceae bacterium]
MTKCERSMGRRLKNRRGGMLLFVAVSMVGLLGLVAIATDIGAAQRQRRIAQTAADAAAIGGGRQIERHQDSSTVATYALSSAQKNFFPNSEVTVFYPPQTGLHIGDLNYVEVVVGRRIKTLFGGMFNKDSIDIAARAVAGMGSNALYCVYNMATSGNGIDWDGRMTTNCDVVGNASIYLKKGIDGNPTPDVSAVGTVDGGGSGHTFSGIPPFPDPYANLVTMPTDTACQYNNVVVTKDTALTPGVYCGGIRVNDNIKATLDSGVYLVRGGGVRGGQFEAFNGVTIINTNGPGNNPATYAPFTMGNNCSFHVRAPSGGPYRGIAVVVDPAAPESMDATQYVNDFCGKGTNAPCISTTVDIQGIAYLPKQAFRIGNSNAKLTIAGTLIAKYMTSHSGGEGCFFLDQSGNSPLKRLSLVE